MKFSQEKSTGLSPSYAQEMQSLPLRIACLPSVRLIDQLLKRNLPLLSRTAPLRQHDGEIDEVDGAIIRELVCGYSSKRV